MPFLRVEHQTEQNHSVVVYWKMPIDAAKREIAWEIQQGFHSYRVYETEPNDPFYLRRFLFSM